MVILWLPTLVLSLILSVGLVIVLTAMLPQFFMLLVSLGAMVFLGFNLMFGLGNR